MNKLTVALISGGTSSERQVSLNSGDQVFKALDAAKYQIRRYDPQFDLPRLVTEAPDIDVALIILHGPMGEDGTIQGLLDLLNIPYQGTGVLGSALAMNKLAAKQMYEKAGLRVPPYRVARKDAPFDADAAIDALGLPVVIKPVSGGSSIGMSIVRSRDDVRSGLHRAFGQEDTALVEAYIKGVELTGAVVGNDELRAYPLVEIIPDPRYDFFDYEAKYTPGAATEICPARISQALTHQAQDYATRAHKALFCRGYSRTDMILQGETLFVIETNTIPGMTPTSLLPMAAKAAGVTFSELLDTLIDLSLNDRKKR